MSKPGTYAGFLGGVGPTSKNFDFGYTCRKAECREPMLGGFGDMLPKKCFKNGAFSCVLTFEGYFQPLS